MASARGIPWPSVSMLRLTPPFPRSVGLGPVFFPTQGRFRHRAIHRQPRPINTLQHVDCQQTSPPERLEYAGANPLLKPTMR